LEKKQLTSSKYNPQHGWTPLHYAAANGREAVVRMLVVEGGMDVNIKDNVSVIVVMNNTLAHPMVASPAVAFIHRW